MDLDLSLLPRWLYAVVCLYTSFQLALYVSLLILYGCSTLCFFTYRYEFLSGTSYYWLFIAYRHNRVITIYFAYVVLFRLLLPYHGSYCLIQAVIASSGWLLPYLGYYYVLYWLLSLMILFVSFYGFDARIWTWIRFFITILHVGIWYFHYHSWHGIHFLPMVLGLAHVTWFWVYQAVTLSAC